VLIIAQKGAKMDKNICHDKYALACAILEFTIKSAEEELKSEVPVSTLKRILKIAEDNE
jgi:hypothetical protein